MRNELIHFLQETTDQTVMLAFIKELDFHNLVTLFHYLSFTDTYTSDRWLDVYANITG